VHPDGARRGILHPHRQGPRDHAGRGFRDHPPAEENGLVHQIPNTDGPGKTHAICNCCGCSCLSLRTAEMFINTDMVRSNYVSHVDKDKCVACGECVEACPVNALQLGQRSAAWRPSSCRSEKRPATTTGGPKNGTRITATTAKTWSPAAPVPVRPAAPPTFGIQG
jgi:Fe-S-cluster-containing hydrogenase component 2